LILLEIFRDYLVGMENIIVNFHCNQMTTKNVIVCYQTTVRT